MRTKHSVNLASRSTFYDFSSEADFSQSKMNRPSMSYQNIAKKLMTSKSNLLFITDQTFISSKTREHGSQSIWKKNIHLMTAVIQHSHVPKASSQ